MSAKAFDALYASLPADGWLTLEEAELLLRAAGRTVGPILEVGVYHGKSSVLLASLGRPMYCVDPFAGFNDQDQSGRNARNAWLVNMLRAGARAIEDGRVDPPLPWHDEGEVTAVLHTCRIEDWEPRRVGFAYLDGDHTYPGTRSQIAKALACDPAVIAVHDVSDSGGGVAIRNACLDALGPWVERAGKLAVWDVTKILPNGLRELTTEEG